MKCGKYLYIASFKLMESRALSQGKWYIALLVLISVMARSQPGPLNPMYGRKHSEETKQKMRAAIHIVMTPEHRQKISQGKLGKHIKPFTAEHKRKIALSRMAEKNPMWKGDKLQSLSGKHNWIRRRLPKPDICLICKTNPPLDLSNISGKYLRDLNDWQWLCRKCHMLSDGRLERFRNYGLYYQTQPKAKMYEFHNRCSTCEKWLSKVYFWCPVCKQRTRKRAWNKSSARR